jgi:hypothetical protein
MRFPARLKVGAHDIEVKYPYQFIDRCDLCGQYDSALGHLKVCEVDGNGTPRTRQAILITYLHEVLHAVDYTYNSGCVSKESDASIEQLAQGLAQVLIDNDLLGNGRLEL